MKTTNKINVVKLNNGTEICKCCGNKLKTESETFYYNHGRGENTTIWYECDCEEWMDAIEHLNALNKLNEEIERAYSEYREKFDSANSAYIRKYGKANSKEFDSCKKYLKNE